MRRDKKKGKRKKFGSQNKLSLFQKPEMKFGSSCPRSQKNSPVVDYNNLKLNGGVSVLNGSGLSSFNFLGLNSGFKL